MNRAQTDAILEFEHSHDRLSERVLRLRGMLGPSTRAIDLPPSLIAELRELREELLLHFAREEEGLFPYVRAHLPDQCAVVDRLEATHDGLCGAIVRLAHLAERRADAPALGTVFERFVRAYSEHGKDEDELFRTLEQRLEPHQRGELAEIVRGL